MNRHLKLFVSGIPVALGTVSVLGAGGLLTPALSPVGGFDSNAAVASGFVTTNTLGNSIIVPTNFISGQIYSNGYGTPITVSGCASLIAAATAGRAILELQVLGVTTNKFVMVTAAGTVAGGYTNYISIEVTNTGLYTFTNMSVGAGNSGTVTSGQILVPGNMASIGFQTVLLQEMTNIVNQGIQDFSTNTVTFSFNGTNTTINTTNTLDVPNGITGVSFIETMVPILYGSNVVNTMSVMGINPYSVNITNASIVGTLPPSFVFTNSVTTSNNMVFYVQFPRGLMKTNDPYVGLTTYRIAGTSPLSNAVYTLSYVGVSNRMRWDNLAFISYGNITNDFTASGAGAKMFHTNVVITGFGPLIFTNTLFDGALIRIDRNDDGYLLPCGLSPNVIFGAVK